MIAEKDAEMRPLKDIILRRGNVAFAGDGVESPFRATQEERIERLSRDTIKRYVAFLEKLNELQESSGDILFVTSVNGKVHTPYGLISITDEGALAVSVDYDGVISGYPPLKKFL